MAGVVIATAWISFLSILASMILLILYSKYSMKDGTTEAEQLKARQLGMAGFWVLVVGLIFALIAAITASCLGKLGSSINNIFDGVKSRLGSRSVAGSNFPSLT